MKHFCITALLISVLISPISCANQSAREARESNSNASVVEEGTQFTLDFNEWNGSYFNHGGEGGGIRLEGKENTLKAFDAADETPLEVELMEGGVVIIDGAEAFLSNDTLRLVLNGSGGSREAIYVREELNYVN